MSKLSVETETGITYVIDFHEMTWARSNPEKEERGIPMSGSFHGIRPIVLGGPLFMTIPAPPEWQEINIHFVLIQTSNVVSLVRLKKGELL